MEFREHPLLNTPSLTAMILHMTDQGPASVEAFAARLLELLLADPDFATTIRRSAGSAGEDPVL